MIMISINVLEFFVFIYMLENEKIDFSITLFNLAYEVYVVDKTVFHCNFI